ncbi:hypothetical protein LXL04_028534 [Taraxacum kok-saghyz]
MAEMDEFDFMGRWSNDVNGVDVRAAIDGVMACLWVYAYCFETKNPRVAVTSHRSIPSPLPSPSPSPSPSSPFPSAKKLTYGTQSYLSPLFKMNLYKVGMRVEVVGHSDGFWNSYYGAKLLRVDRTKFGVRYEELVDEDYREYTMEDVDLKHIRPYPPDSFDINYRLTVGDDVDVYERDGWWRGEVVFDELDDELMVYFSYMTGDDTEDFTTFTYNDVRIHQEVKQVGKGFAWSHVKIAGSK